MDLLGGLTDLRKSAESFDPMTGLTNTMGSVTSGVGGAMGGLTDAVGSVGSVVPNPLDILNEEKDINELPTAEAADIIWDRMRDYMKEKGGQRATELFKEIDKDRSGKIDKKEMKAALEKMGIKGVSMKVVKAVIKSVDPNGGGELAYKDLLPMLKEPRGAAKKKKKEAQSEQKKKEEEAKKEEAKRAEAPEEENVVKPAEDSQNASEAKETDEGGKETKSVEPSEETLENQAQDTGEGNEDNASPEENPKKPPARKPSLSRQVSTTKLDSCDLSQVESTDHAVALIWNRMHAYMEEKGSMRVKELFVEIDKDRSGKIDLDELSRFLDRMNISGASKKVLKAFNKKTIETHLEGEKPSKVMKKNDYTLLEYKHLLAVMKETKSTFKEQGLIEAPGSPTSEASFEETEVTSSPPTVQATTEPAKAEPAKAEGESATVEDDLAAPESSPASVVTAPDPEAPFVLTTTDGFFALTFFGPACILNYCLPGTTARRRVSAPALPPAENAPPVPALVNEFSFSACGGCLPMGGCCYALLLPCCSLCGCCSLIRYAPHYQWDGVVRQGAAGKTQRLSAIYQGKGEVYRSQQVDKYCAKALPRCCSNAAHKVVLDFESEEALLRGQADAIACFGPCCCASSSDAMPLVVGRLVPVVRPAAFPDVLPSQSMWSHEPPKSMEMETGE